MMAILSLALLCLGFALEFKPSSSEVIQIIANKSLLRTPEIGYVHFIFHAQSKLDVENKAKLFAHYPKQCALGCAMNMTCKSFNFGKQPLFFSQGEAQYLCELLPTDKYNSSSVFETQNPKFNHYSIRSKCTDSPCLHNFPCLANYIKDTYQCLCPRPPFQGKHCKDIDECTSGQHDCSPNANCTNVIGSFNCTCKAGYVGNGKSCSKPPMFRESEILRDHGNASYHDALRDFMANVSEDITNVTWKRCWSGTRDGWDVTQIFHSQCDGKGPTVTIAMKNKYIWGGYTDVPWTSSGGYKQSSKSFLFSLYNIKGFNPQRFVLVKLDEAVYHPSTEGPTFGSGHDFKIGNSAFDVKSCQSKPSAYAPPPGCINSNFCSFYASQVAEHTLDDVEVFYKSTN